MILGPEGLELRFSLTLAVDSTIIRRERISRDVLVGFDVESP